MTGQKLRQILFTKRGDIAAFAKYCNMQLQYIVSRFEAKKIDIDVLKKYAAWKGINEAEFISYATGPAPAYDAPPEATGIVNEPHSKKKSKEILTEGFNQNSQPMPYSIIMKMLENQEHQNESMRMLARAAEVNAMTIARLSGIQDVELGKVAAS